MFYGNFEIENFATFKLQESDLVKFVNFDDSSLKDAITLQKRSYFKSYMKPLLIISVSLSHNIPKELQHFPIHPV